MKGEPVLTLVAGVTGVANAAMGVAVAFGVPLTPPQILAINTLVVAVMAVITRSKVSPVDTASAVNLSQVGKP